MSRPQGENVAQKLSDIANDTRGCNKTAISGACKGKYNQKFCTAMNNACPVKDNEKLECKKNDNSDDNTCLTCNEVYNKVCKSRGNHCPTNIQALVDICPPPEQFTNTNNFDYMLLYIIILFAIYKIIYKK